MKQPARQQSWEHQKPRGWAWLSLLLPPRRKSHSKRKQTRVCSPAGGWCLSPLVAQELRGKEATFQSPGWGWGMPGSFRVPPAQGAPGPGKSRGTVWGGKDLKTHLVPPSSTGPGCSKPGVRVHLFLCLHPLPRVLLALSWGSLSPDLVFQPIFQPIFQPVHSHEI